MKLLQLFMYGILESVYGGQKEISYFNVAYPMIENAIGSTSLSQTLDCY